jgi:hypothetical protein
MVTRRALLRGGGGLLAAAAGGVAARSWQTGLLPMADDPRALWRQWRTLPWPTSLIAAGVLASNPHNTQPWLFRPSGEDIALEIDQRQALGPVDPFLRQMWLAAGCAVENMAAAAAGLGHLLEVITVAATTVAARLSRGPAAAARPEVLDRISRRHTNRGPYHRDQPVPRSFVDELHALASDPAARIDLFDRNEPRGRDFADATVDATRSLIADAAFMQASDVWFRQTPRQEEQHRDGPSLRCSGLPAWKRVLATLGPRLGDRASHEAWLALTAQQHCATAPAFGAISVRDPADHRQLLEAGRLWQRLQLAATALGLGFQPLDQLLELADRERQLGLPATAEPRLIRLAEPGWHPILTFRLGWPLGLAPASARRALAGFVVTGSAGRE